jgi:hypothetical protein
MLEATPVGNEEIADWIEIAILSGGHRGNTNHQLEIWANDFCGLSPLQVAGGLKVIERRAQILRDLYPFEINELAVVLDRSKCETSYVYLLLASRPSYSFKWQTSSPTNEESEVFEVFVSKCLENYLGTDAQAIPFGWPSKFGRPMEFHLAINWLADKLGIKQGSGFRPPRRKDGGVDVVAWKPFKDRRTGFPVYLVQCTLQKEFTSKARDIDLRLWAGWLEMDRDPMTILAIPKTVPPGEQWNEISANAIIFDRLRLAQCSEDSIHPEMSQYLKDKLSVLSDYGTDHLA